MKKKTPLLAIWMTLVWLVACGLFEPAPPISSLGGLNPPLLEDAHDIQPYDTYANDILKFTYYSGVGPHEANELLRQAMEDEGWVLKSGNSSGFRVPSTGESWFIESSCFTRDDDHIVLAIRNDVIPETPEIRVFVASVKSLEEEHELCEYQYITVQSATVQP